MSDDGNETFQFFFDKSGEQAIESKTTPMVPISANCTIRIQYTICKNWI